MSLFKRNKVGQNVAGQSALAEVALKHINEGVIITDKNGIVEFINPAAVTMTNTGSYHNVLGIEYSLVIKLESKEGRELPENENPLVQAMKTGQPLESFRGNLIVGNTDKRVPVAISVVLADNSNGERIVTFRNITKELQEEGEQTEFISTASHEMRTPVATIDGYLSLALNPQTAAIDERARGYLTAAQAASKHLGKLFQDLLDVTKLDDGRIRPHFTPTEMVGLVRMISNDYLPQAKEKKITFTFGSNETIGAAHRMEQLVYGFVDIDFMREILDNLVGNAIKYTPEGGSIYINARGDGDRVLINVTDTGIGISSDDIGHIFQKFYRADNSDTRTIGGTGLGLYLVKQRVEAMGGKVWAESAFGEGSTFYVSLPRITGDEYEKRMIAVRQAEMAKQLTDTPQAVSTTAPDSAPIPTPIPVLAPAAINTPVTPPAPTVPPLAAPTAQPPTAAQTPPVPSLQNQNNNNLNGEVK